VFGLIPSWAKNDMFARRTFNARFKAKQDSHHLAQFQERMALGAQMHHCGGRD
jgi:hypothetical protein